jgi:hypothetical protein
MKTYHVTITATDCSEWEAETQEEAEALAWEFFKGEPLTNNAQLDTEEVSEDSICSQ